MTAPRPCALVVDDNVLNLELVRFILEADGFDVVCVHDAAAFDSALREHRPDVVLMDIQLPGTDGVTLTRRLRADPATAAIPVIAVTAHAMRGDEQRLRAAGCDDYIAKPINPATFAQRVRVSLD